MKNYDKNKESSYVQYLDPNNLYGWAMSQKLPVDGFKWITDTSLINEKFNKFIRLIKNYDEDSIKGYIFEVDIDYPKEKIKINKCKKHACNLYDKKTMSFT